MIHSENVAALVDPSLDSAMGEGQIVEEFATA